MNTEGTKPTPLREDSSAREELLAKLDRYLDVPLALASLAMVLLAIIEVSEPWRGRLATLGWGSSPSSPRW